MDVKQITEAVAKALIPEISKLGSRMDRMEGRMEEMSSRLTDINGRLSDINGRMLSIEERMLSLEQQTIMRIDKLREELSQQIGETNKRIDRLYEVIVRREEHKSLDRRVLGLEKKVREIEEKIAA